jgi:hypothetical protein
MDRAVLITIVNAQYGLLLPCDLSFYASDLYCHNLRSTVDQMHRRQLTPAAYDAFADVVGDWYARRHSGFAQAMMACAAVATGYRFAARWCKTAYHTAINIHLNTVGARDHCAAFPRIVPPPLADWRIEKPEQITRDLLWRILVTEPWLGYAERMRAQYARMADVFSRDEIDLLPKQIERLEALKPLSEAKPWQRRYLQRTTRHRIRRAFKLHDRLFGLKHLRSVLTDRLVLTGHYYRYRLTVDPGDLEYYSEETNTGTPPIHITLLDKTADMSLGTLCIYFENTPLIDFLTAILLHLKTPALELELLQTGQVQNVTSAFFRDPLLPELKGMHDPSTAPDTYITNLITHVNGDDANDGLRGIVDAFDWEPMVEEMMGYPEALLQAMAHRGSNNPWHYILNTETAAPVLDAVKRYFRSVS